MTGAASPRLLAALALVATGLPAHAADPSTYLLQPIVTLGEHEIDFHLGAGSGGRSTPPERAAGLGFGMALSQRWYSEVAVQYQRVGSLATQFDAVEWENKFQLTETGKYPVDVGFIVEMERPRNHAEGWEVRSGPLFQTDFGKIQLNANALFKRNYRAEGLSETQFLYQWQAKYRWRPQFEFGLQGFDEVGKWDQWATEGERSHRAGPAVFGMLPLGGRQKIRYNAAWLLGASPTAPDHTFRMQVEYEY